MTACENGPSIDLSAVNEGLGRYRYSTNGSRADRPLIELPSVDDVHEI
jgi:hypothetical protein